MPYADAIGTDPNRRGGGFDRGDFDTVMSLLRYFGLVIGYLLIAESLAQGGVPGYPDDLKQYDIREVATLPEYCKYTQSFRDRVPGGDNKTEIDHWYETLGPTFHAMHHYCWGLMKTNRALLLTRTQQWKTFYLGSAIDEFDYVIRDAPPDFVLLPEIRTKRGQNLILLGQAPLGIVELEKVIDAKPDYWPPYATLSDYYKKTGDVGKARDILEKGLAASPDAKPLSLRLIALQSVASGKSKKGQNSAARQR